MKKSPPPRDAVPVTIDRARAVKPKALERFARLCGAKNVSVGITRIAGDYGVKVNLRTAPSAGVELPNDIEGVPIHVAVVGDVESLASED